MRGLRSLKRYFRDAAHGVFRNFSLSLASISCITITLIVVAVSLVLSMNVQNFSDSIRKDVTVVMFLKGDTTKEDETKILNELKSITNIEDSSIMFKSKTESANELKMVMKYLLLLLIDGLKKLIHFLIVICLKLKK